MIQVTRGSMPIARSRYASRGNVAEQESGGEKVAEFEDWEDASRVVADVYFPHELTVLSGTDRPELQLSSVDFGPVMIGRLTWGVDVAIECEYPGAYEINIPLAGVLESRGDGGAVVSGRGQASVFSADTPNRITRWDATCSVLGVKFDRDHLEREADRILGAPLRSRLVLPDQIDLTGSADDWRRLVAALSDQLEGAGSLTNPLVSQQLAGAVTTAFVLAVSPPSEEAAPAPRPGMVRRSSTRCTTTRHAHGPLRTWRRSPAPACGVCRRHSPTMWEAVRPRPCSTSDWTARTQNSRPGAPASR